MVTFRLPFFVTLCLSTALTLSACEKNEPKEVEATSAGMDHPVAQALAAGTWCSSHETNDQREIRITQYTFNRRGTYLRTRLLLLQDGSLKKESSETQRWAVLNDQVFLLQDGVARSKQLELQTRATDGTSCLNLNEADSALQICPCSL